MAGGSVRGKQILGKYPESLVAGVGANILDGHGRVLPSTPFDAVFHGVAQWLGLEEDAQLDRVLPNRKQFDESVMFTKADMFA